MIFFRRNTMKKVIALALSAVMALSIVACSKTEPRPAETYKTGLGIITTATTRDATADADGQVQVNTNMVVATFDKDGKVVSATIDVAQQTGKVSAEGKVVGDIDTRTKCEKGDDYGMRGVSTIGKEVNEQYAALADWFVGKTVDEIMAVETYRRDDNHPTVPAEGTDLSASVTISIGTYLDALKLAYENAVETTGPVASTGLGTDISVSKSDATAEADGQIQVNTTMMGAAFDAEGKVVAVKTDVAQQTAKFDTTGHFTNEIDLRTKVQKGADYGMKGASAIGKEINEQFAALEEYLIGKTADEFAATEVYQKDDHHIAVPVEGSDLAAGVSISINSQIVALAKAAANAK